MGSPPSTTEGGDQSADTDASPTSDQPIEEYPLPPGPGGYPVIGHSHHIIRDPFAFIDRLAEYGDVIQYRALGRTFTVLLDPEYIERVLVTEPDRFERFLFAEEGFDFASKGILFNDNEQGNRQRQLMRPAFTVDRIRAYADTMVDYTERTVDEWTDDPEIELNRMFSGLTLRILSKTLFDIDLRSKGDDDVIARAAQVINERADTGGLNLLIPDWLPTPANRRYERAMRRYRERMADLITNRQTENLEADDLLAILMEADGPDGYTLSDEEIQDNLITFMFAGHETTSLALTYTCLLLAKHDDIMAELRGELAAELDGETPRFEHVPRLEYTERVIKEALRLYPPVYTMWRKITTETVFGGYRIPEGTILTLPQFRIHRDERFYDVPDKFNPDRWADDRESERLEYAYFPFGGGPRHCIGMRFAMLELQLVIATLIQRVDMTLLSDPTPELSPMTTLQPEDDIRVRIQHNYQGNV